MRVKFWGTRGSIPTPITTEAIRRKLRQVLLGAAGLDLADPEVLGRYLERLPPALYGTVGGDTPCIEIAAGNQLLILDAGSGLRNLNADLVQRGYPPEGGTYHFLMTHTHWDHVQGFPFFDFAFEPTNDIVFYSAVADLKARFNRLLDPTWSPGLTNKKRANFKFVYLPPDIASQVGNLQITPMELQHPGQSYGYRIEWGDKCLVYASDAAYQQVETKYVNFFRQADMLIFDSHFSFRESIDKVDWGHSTAMFGAEFAYRAQIKRLVLFHHDPLNDDKLIYQARLQAQRYLLHRTFLDGPCEVIIGQDGLKVEI